MTSHFIVTLPSNSSMGYYPDNTVSKFTTKLPTTWDMDSGEWEVGLAEMSCPGRMVHILPGECSIRVVHQDLQHPQLCVTSHLTLREGNYHTMDELAWGVNVMMTMPDKLAGRDNSLKDNVCLAHLQYDEVRNRFDMSIDDGVRLRFNDNLARRLGFEGGAEYEVAGSGGPPKHGYVNVKNLYIYCDLLEPVPVGDVKAPLLRIVPLDENVRQYSNTYKVMKCVLFVPLKKKHFDMIEMQILDDQGEVVPFADGKSHVVLEFRRAAHPYFLTN